MGKPKIAVYAVCLNEIEKIHDFIKSILGADYILICDTGSTDGTSEVLDSYLDSNESQVIDIKHISISPWRFDDARNTSLNLLPEDIDYCWCLDIDERFIGDWDNLREKLTDCPATRISYNYVFSWLSPGVPQSSFYTDKFHARKGYRWIYPCHETLTRHADDPEIRIALSKDDFQIHHFATKRSRSQYLPLLAQATKEYPTHDRPAFYYARELMYHTQWIPAINEFERYIQLPTGWSEEKAEACILIGDCYKNIGINSLPSYLRALNFYAKREAFWKIAWEYYHKQDWKNVYAYVNDGLALNRQYNYLEREEAWGSDLYDMASMAAYKLNDLSNALKYGELACQAAPENERLKNNLKFYTTRSKEQSNDYNG
jgi:glycosyltransferase involved in cell wall biosynthesis